MIKIFCLKINQNFLLFFSSKLSFFQCTANILLQIFIQGIVCSFWNALMFDGPNTSKSKMLQSFDTFIQVNNPFKV